MLFGDIQILIFYIQTDTLDTSLGMDSFKKRMGWEFSNYFCYLYSASTQKKLLNDRKIII